MELLTLDTNILRDIAWAKGLTNDVRYGGDLTIQARIETDINELMRLRDIGQCEFAVTTQIYTDFERPDADLPDHIGNMIGPFASLASPSISTFPMTFPFVFADTSEIENIMHSVFPGSGGLKQAHKRHRKDALQLYAHKVARRDFFLTSDKSILRVADTLGNEFGINVITLEGYIAKNQIP